MSQENRALVVHGPLQRLLPVPVRVLDASKNDTRFLKGLKKIPYIIGE